MQRRLKVIGYWKGDSQSQVRWPDVRNFVDPSWDADERYVVERYLSSGIMVVGYMGLSPCRVCGAKNGSLDLSDGLYVWPEGFSHYVADHDVRPPREFVDHVLQTMDSFEGFERDEAWWRSYVTDEGADRV